jgi:thimet oligopeptidase
VSPAPRTNDSALSLGELTFDLGPDALRRASTDAIERSQRELDAIVGSRAPRTVESVLDPLDLLLARVRDVGSHGSLIFAVHPDEATRAAGRDLSESADRFFNAFRLNDGAYGALRALDLGAAEADTRFAVDKILREMRRAGVEKDPATRDRLLELNNEIDRTSNQYGENIANLPRSIVVDSPAALAGLPEDYLAAHRPAADGRIRITTSYPDALPVLGYADRADVRRRLLFEIMNRAYPENSAVIERLLALRNEFARTLGYASYAEYAIEDKMMRTPRAARDFLDRVGRLLEAPTRADLERLLARKRWDLPDADRLDPWDTQFFGQGYYEEKIREEEFGVDLRVLRRFLSFVRVRDGLFGLCRDLFGIEFHRAANAAVWHPTVEAYDVRRGSELLGRAYLDLTPRPGKFNHAACFGVRDGVAGRQLPQAALVCNFLDPGTPPAQARLEYGSVVTFFHEFGHLLHALLSGRTRWLYNGHAFVEWDFIEAPSQLFEEWARDPATLARFAVDPDTGEPVPADLLGRLRAADALWRAKRYLRQVALSSISLELYDRAPPGPELPAVLREAYEHRFPDTFPPEYHFETSFGHLAGYSAIYYTYVWSVVIARDLLQPFFDRGTLTDPEIAARYAREILAAGSDRPAAELIRAYLGRPFSFDAFERWVNAPVTSGPGVAPPARSADRAQSSQRPAKRSP